MVRGKRCVAHTHEYLAPEEYHHLRPQCRGGLTRPDNMVWLCANAHSDVHYFLDLIEKQARAAAKHPERIPRAAAEHYGPKVRQLARLGWSKYAAEFEAGLLDGHILLWDTSGRPADTAPLTIPPYEAALATSEAAYLLKLARQHLNRKGPAATGFEWAALPGTD